jgi:AcrR family transcriptional regulator
MSSRAKRKPRYHHGNLPAALVEAAAEIAAERGARAVTLRAVAERVGVTHSAPYRHFKDKGALLAAVAEDGFRRLARALRAERDRTEQASREPARSGAATLGALGAAYVRFALERPAQFRLMFGDGHERSAGETLREAIRATLAEVRGALLAARRQGGLRPDDVETAALLLWAQWHGIAVLVGAGGIARAGADERSSGARVETLAARGATQLLAGPPSAELLSAAEALRVLGP